MDRETTCDAYGENLVTTTLPVARWMNHHDGTNSQVHNMFRQLGMINDMEVEDYFMRRLQDRALIQPQPNMPLLSNQRKGKVLDGHQTGIANGSYPTGIN